MPQPKRHTPRWAFEPWISKDISSTDDTRAFVEGFRSRDIPVGVVVLDSPWETSYHSFIPNPSRYGGFDGLVDELHGKGIKLVLWMTSNMNETSFDGEKGGASYEGPAPDFERGATCGYYVNGGETSFWWKGRGAGVDFFNPEAVAWWHGLQRRILPKIDGWKLDFGENYIKSFAERWAIARLLDQGQSGYREIALETGSSTTTVARVSRFLKQENYQGYRMVLDRLKSK